MNIIEDASTSGRANESAREGGRVREIPKGGAQVLARVTQELRDALEQEATRAGRSISRVAEGWMETGRDTSLYVQQALGGHAVAPTLLAFAEAYRKLSQGESLTKEVLVEAWMHLADKMLPDTLPASASNQRSVAAMARLQESFAAVADQLRISSEAREFGSSDWLRALHVVNVAISEENQQLGADELLARMKSVDVDGLRAAQDRASKALEDSALTGPAAAAYFMFMRAVSDAATAAIMEIKEFSDVRKRARELADQVAALPGEDPLDGPMFTSALASFLRQRQSA